MWIDSRVEDCKQLHFKALGALLLVVSHLYRVEMAVGSLAMIQISCVWNGKTNQFHIQFIHASFLDFNTSRRVPNLHPLHSFLIVPFCVLHQHRAHVQGRVFLNKEHEQVTVGLKATRMKGLVHTGSDSQHQCNGNSSFSVRTTGAECVSSYRKKLKGNVNTIGKQRGISSCSNRNML